jgi:cell division protein FtsN
LILEDNLYKVRVSGFATSNEVKESFPLLESQGISEIGLILFKGMLGSGLTTQIPDIATDPVKTYSEKDTDVIIHEIIEEDMTSTTDSYVIQLGAFNRKVNAYELRKKLADKLDKEVVITVQDEYYKVRVIGFETSYEVKSYIPDLVRNGFREIWIVNLKGTQKQEIPLDKMKPGKEVIDSFTDRDTTFLIIDETNVEMMTTGKESYAIQVGAFNLKINADVLRIKLATILGKDVEIFVDDDLYKVLLPGFQTRDEVDAFIPMLQKNGVSEVRIVNLIEKQKHWISTSRIDTIAEGFENKKIISEKKKEELPAIPTEEKATKKTEVKEQPVNVTIVEEPKKEIPEEPSSVERKKSFEERLLEAEYRSGLYEARWPGVEFRIQIAASKSISDPDVIKRKFDLSSDVEVVKGGEWYRFSVGHYIKFWQAREYRNILISRHGIDDAFIVAYKEGKKIMFTDLLAMVENTPDATTGLTVRHPVSKAFSVQILATKDGNISVSEIREKYDVDEEIFKEYNQSDGLYRYSIGDFSSYAEAAKVRNRIRASGIRDAFVVGYKDGKRVEDPRSIL